jgi:type IV pilus assembly protein PilM
MAEKMIYAEVGRSLVKVCLVSEKGRRRVIKHGFMFNTPPDSVNDGDIVDPVALAAVLKKNLRDNGARHAKAITFSLVSGKTATREVQIPPVKPNRVKALVEANASEYLPVEVSRYKITYGMLKNIKDETGTEKSNLQIIASPLNILDSYAKLAEAAGLRLAAIDFVGNSQFQVVKSMKTPNVKTTNVTMCVNVAESSTYVTFSKHDRLLLQRILPFGGDDLVLEYLSKTGGTDYLDALTKCSVPITRLNSSTDGVLDSDDARAALNRLANGIARSLDFYAGKHSEPIDSVILAGTCAHVSGLQEIIESATESDRKGRIYYLEGQYGAASMGDPNLVAKYISSFGSSIDPVDLLPDKYKVATGLVLKAAPTEEAKLTMGLTVFSGGLLIGLALTVFALIGYTSASKNLDQAEKTLQRLAQVEIVYQDYLATKSKEDGFDNLDKMLDTPNKDLNAFLTELEQKMPSALLLLSAVFTEEDVLLNIVVRQYDEAAKVISAFRTFESIDIIEISTVTRTVDEETLIPRTTFSLRAVYKKTETANSEE